MLDRVETSAGKRRLRRAGAVAAAAVVILLARPVVVGALPGAPLQGGPGGPGGTGSTTSTTAATTTTTETPTTTTTTAPPPTTPAPTAPPPTVPPVTDTAPPPPPAEDEEPEPTTTEDDATDEVAAVAAPESRTRTFTTTADLLIQGDGTPGAESTTTTTRQVASEGNSADEESRMIWMIVAGLSGLALLIALLTWRYWLLTRPGLDTTDDDDDEGDDPYPGPGPGGGRRPVRSGEWGPPTAAGAAGGAAAGAACRRRRPVGCARGRHPHERAGQRPSRALRLPERPRRPAWRHAGAPPRRRAAGVDARAGGGHRFDDAARPQR